MLWWLEHLHFWHSTVMWLGSIFGCFSPKSVIIKAVKHGKVCFIETNSFLYLSGKVFLEEFCCGCIREEMVGTGCRTPRQDTCNIKTVWHPSLWVPVLQHQGSLKTLCFQHVIHISWKWRDTYCPTDAFRLQQLWTSASIIRVQLALVIIPIAVDGNKCLMS